MKYIVSKSVADQKVMNLLILSEKNFSFNFQQNIIFNNESSKNFLKDKIVKSFNYTEVEKFV
jgi:hypothetical protein